MFRNVTPILGNIQDRCLKSSLRESFAAAFMKAEMNQIAQASSSTGWLLRSASKNKLNTSTYSVSFKESAGEWSSVAAAGFGLPAYQKTDGSPKSLALNRVLVVSKGGGNKRDAASRTFDSRHHIMSHPRADFSGLLGPKVTHLNLSAQTASWVRSFALSAPERAKESCVAMPANSSGV